MIALKGKTCLNFPGALQKPDQNWDFIADNYLKGISSKHCLTAHASSKNSEGMWNLVDDEYMGQLIDQLKKSSNLMF